MKKSARVFTVLCVFLLLAQTLFAGGSKESEKVVIKKETLKIALESPIVGMDPKTTVDRYSGNVYGCIYEPLLVYDEDDNIVANSIVDSFSQLNATTYNFKLKKGILFHNGDELKSNDVKFSLERGIGTSMNYLVGEIDHVQIVNDYEFNIIIKSSNGAFLAGLTAVQTGILNEKYVTEKGDSYQLAPVGTGPYKFGSWKQGVSVTLERNEEYHGKAPYYKTLAFYEITDSTSRANALEVGEVDVAPLAAIDVSRFDDVPGFNLVRANTFGLIYIGMNYQAKAVKDQKVRDAIAYAVDTAAITNATFLGNANVATAILSPNVTFSIAAETKPNRYDPAKAKQLLAEAGFSVANPLNLVLVIDTRSDVTSVGTMLKEYLNQVGINVDIRTGDKATQSGTYYAKGNYDIFVGTWYCATPDANSQIVTTLHSANNGATGGYVWFNDPKMDKLIEDARSSTDFALRANLYKQIQERVQNEKWWVPVLYYVDTWCAVDGIGIENVLDPTGYHQWHKIAAK